MKFFFTYFILFSVQTFCLALEQENDIIQQFQNFIKTFNKEYLHDEYIYRFNIFSKNNLEIKNTFCSSVVRSFNYINNFKNEKYIAFLDIGFLRSSLILFRDGSLHLFKNIPIGGQSITKDISYIMKIDLKESEEIKHLFNKSETEFSYANETKQKEDNLTKKLITKKISIDLLKKVILQRDKSYIAENLNGKTEKIVFCELTDLQYEIYKNILKLPEFELIKTNETARIFGLNKFQRKPFLCSACESVCPKCGQFHTESKQFNLYCFGGSTHNPHWFYTHRKCFPICQNEMNSSNFNCETFKIKRFENKKGAKRLH